MQIREALRKFQIQMEADGRSVHTQRQYRRCIELLVAWADLQAIDKVSRLTHEHVAAFLTSPAARCRADGQPKNATSMNALRSAIRVFLRYCHDAGWVKTNAGRLVRRAVCGTPPPRALSIGEEERLRKLLAGAETREERRDAVMFRLMLDAGLRLGSTLALRSQDIDLVQSTVRVLVKGNRIEEVVLPSQVRHDLERHLQLQQPGYIFTGHFGMPLTGRHVQRRFVLWRQRAEMRSTVSCHSLRHSFALRLLERTGDIELVRRALTHQSISSTQVYARCAERRLRNALG